MSLLVIECMTEVDSTILFILTLFKLGSMKMLEEQVALKNPLIILFTTALVLKCCMDIRNW